MVLHEEHGELEVVADLADELAEVGDLLVVQPAGRLVQQKEARLRHERASELDALLDPVRQRRCREERPVAEADDVEDLEGFLLTCAPPSAVRPDQDVVEHRHRAEELDVLERPRDALAHDLERGLLEKRRSVEQNVARCPACRDA